MRQSDQVVQPSFVRTACELKNAARRTFGIPGPMRTLSIIVLSLLITGCNLDFGRKASSPDEKFWAFSEDTPSRLQSLLTPGKTRAEERAHRQRLYSGEGEKELAAAELVEAQDPLAAAKAYDKIAKRYKDSSTGEEAQLRAANLLYESTRLAAAQDAYSQLLEDYPSTRYMNQATRRLFAISRTWLNMSSPETTSEIKLTSAEEVIPEEQVPTFKRSAAVPVLPNFTDRSRPVFDTPGRAIEGLRTIWLSDPTGELADDALMMTATYYLQKKDFVESDRFFKILREEYPRSPHLKNAYLLGSHVKQMSYQGPLYEGLTLAESKRLKERSLRMFADDHGDRLREELKNVDDEMARRAWSNVDYYQRKKKWRSVAVSCRQVIDSYPNSQYADKARQVLQTIDPSYIQGLPGFGVESRANEIPTGEAQAKY